MANAVTKACEDGLLLGWTMAEDKLETSVGFRAQMGEEPAEPGPTRAKEKARPKRRKKRQELAAPLALESQGAAPILYDGDMHAATIAPTGAGKNRGVIIPNLLRYEGSAIVIDPKGENTRVTARRRREMGQAVYVVDPFHLTTDEPATLNPLDMFDLPRSQTDCDAEMMTDLVQGDGLTPQDPFWDKTSGGLITGLIAHVVTDREPEERTLGMVYDLLFRDDVPYTLAVMLDKNEVSHELARRNMAAFLQICSDKTRPCVLTTAQTHMNFLSSAAARNAMSASTVPIKDLIAGEPMTIYLVIPPEYLSSHGKMLAMWVNLLLKALMTRSVLPERRTLFVLDEVAQLGPMPMLRQAMTLMRGYGLQCWTFWQNLAQLQQNYPRDWQTMLDQCGVLQTFGVTNFRLAKDVSDLMGFGNPHRMMQLPREQQVMVMSGEEPRLAVRCDYLKDAPFQGRYDPNAMYRGRAI